MPEIPEIRVLNPGIGKIGRDRGIAILLATQHPQS